MTALAQLMQRNEDDQRRFWNALDVLLSAEKEARKLIEDCKAAINEHSKKGKALKMEYEKLKASRKQSSNHDSQVAETVLDKGKGKERQPSETPSISNEDDDDNLPRNPIGEEHKNKKNALQHRLRESRIAFHKVLFLKGDVYHVLGSSHEQEENEAYIAAEDLRRMLLRSKSIIVSYQIIVVHDLFSHGGGRQASHEFAWTGHHSEGFTDGGVACPSSLL